MPEPTDESRFDEYFDGGENDDSTQPENPPTQESSDDDKVFNDAFDDLQTEESRN